MIKAFEHKNALVIYNEEIKSIEVLWNGVVDKEAYQLVLTKAFEAAEYHKATYWLSDIRRQEAIGPQLVKWAKNELIPGMINSSLKKIAIVLDNNVFKSFYIDQIKDSFSSIEFYVFPTTHLAQKWFKEFSVL
jgi:hypothetical protein